MPEEGIRAEPVDPSLFISTLPGGKDTSSRAARAPPLRDASCTLDRSIYRCWALPGAQVCLRSSTRVLVRAIVTQATMHASFPLERDDISR